MMGRRAGAGGYADRRPRRRLAAAGPRAGRRPTWSRPRTPAGCAGWPRDLGVELDRPGRLLLRRQRGRPHPRAGRGAAGGRSGCCWSPTPGCPRCPTPATGWWPPRSRPGVRGDRRARPVGRAHRAGAVAGCRWTGSASRASCRARPASGPARLAELADRAAHDGLLRGAAPAGRRAGRDGRGVRRRPAGRRVPGADQDLRGGTPRPGWPSWPRGPPTGSAARSPSSSPGAGPVEAAAPADLVAEVEGLVRGRRRLKEATAEVAARGSGVSRAGRSTTPCSAAA